MMEPGSSAIAAVLEAWLALFLGPPAVGPCPEAAGNGGFGALTLAGAELMVGLRSR